MSLKFEPIITTIPEYFVWFFQEHGEPLTNLKLQKLLYYAQGWHLALNDKPLFESHIEAWVHGPVVPNFYHEYKRYKYGPITAHHAKPNLPKEICEHLKEIINVYGSYSAFELEHLTHNSDPWKIARGDLPADQPSQMEITQESMKIYFKKKMAKNESKKNTGQQAL